MKHRPNGTKPSRRIRGSRNRPSAGRYARKQNWRRNNPETWPGDVPEPKPWK